MSDARTTLIRRDLSSDDTVSMALKAAQAAIEAIEKLAVARQETTQPHVVAAIVALAETMHRDAPKETVAFLAALRPWLTGPKFGRAAQANADRLSTTVNNLGVALVEAKGAEVRRRDQLS